MTHQKKLSLFNHPFFKAFESIFLNGFYCTLGMVVLYGLNLGLVS